MKNLLLLLKVNLSSIFGLNQLYYVQDEKAKEQIKKKRNIFLITILAFGYVSLVYSSMIIEDLVKFHSEILLIAVFALLVSLINIFTTIYKTSSSLFNFKDLDLILSFPIQQKVIVLSRVIIIYLQNLIYCLAVMVPSSFVYLFVVRPDMLVSIKLLTLIFLIPVIPTLIGIIIGIIITYLASFFKKNKFTSLVINVALTIGSIFLYYQFFNEDVNYFNVTNTLVSSIASRYPPLQLLIDGITSNKSYLIFITLNILLILVSVFLINMFYLKLNTILSTNHTKSNYKVKSLKEEKMYKALIHKEYDRYISSHNYVLNTSIILILGIISVIALLIFGSQKIEALIEIPGLSQLITSYAPYILSACTLLSSTTHCSISLEGKSFELIKTLPIPVHQYLMAKVHFSVIISTIATLIIGTILNVYLKTFSLVIYLIPILCSVMMSLIGIIVNLHFPNFDYKNEVAVTKQSLPAFLNSFLGLIIIVLGLLILIKLKMSLNLIYLITIIFLSLVDTLLYLYLTVKGEEIFKSI